MKYRVGDKVKDDGIYNYMVITSISDGSYSYDRYGYSTDIRGSSTSTTDMEYFDAVTTLVERKVKATEVARRMNRGKIKEEVEGIVDSDGHKALGYLIIKA